MTINGGGSLQHDNNIKDRRSLTVVLLSGDYPPDLAGGIGRYTYILANALVNLGHSVHVVTREESHNRVECENGVWVHRIVIKKQFASFLSIIHRVPKSKWNLPKSFLNEIDNISKNEDVDIVHAPISNIVGIAVLFSRRYKLISNLVTTLKISMSVNPELLSNKKKLRKRLKPVVRLEDFIIRNSDGLITSTDVTIDEINKYSGEGVLEGVPIAKCAYGMPDFSLQYKGFKKVDGRLSVLFVGRLERRKGIDLFLQASAKLVGKYDHVDFHVVGGSNEKLKVEKDYRSEFEKQYPEMKDRVIFYGKVSDDELYDHYASCDVFVAPSRFESFGLIYLEAMIFSKAVVGCNVGGVAEVVEHGVTGLLAEPDNVESLENCMTKMIRDDEYRLMCGLEGRKRYKEYFTDSKMAMDISKFYEQFC